MEEFTVSVVSKNLNVSTRMLRYYEQLGLLRSYRKTGYAYRMYDSEAVSRLRQVLVLRRLRIPLRQIQRILQTPDAAVALDVFHQNIAELDRSMEAMAAIRSVLQTLVDKLTETGDVHIPRLVTLDEDILMAIASLTQPGLKEKEEINMEQINGMELQTPLTDLRILYLPPATVASAHVIDDEPETKVNQMLDKFVLDSGLLTRKPDLRHYGFNHPNPKDATGFHGYEMWVTIPEDMDVPAPLVKKHFPGGLYAAHMIAMGNFQDWEKMVAWVRANDEYEFAGDFADQEHMCGLMEEHLNYTTHIQQGVTEPEGMQLDLLMPIRAKGFHPLET